MPHFPPLPETGQDFDQFHNWLRAHTISAQQIITGSLQVGQVISSSNYVAGSSGWAIDGDGNAEFNDVTVRGDIVSGNWDGADPANLLLGFDPTATQGFYLDSSAGVAQFGQGLLVGTTASGGTIQAISGDVSIRLESNRAVPSSNPYILLESNSSPITIIEMLASAAASIQLEASPAGTHMDLHAGSTTVPAQVYLAADNTEATILLSTDTTSATAPSFEVITDQDNGVLALTVSGNSGFTMWASEVGGFSSLSGAAELTSTTSSWWELFTDTASGGRAELSMGFGPALTSSQLVRLGILGDEAYLVLGDATTGYVELAMGASSISGVPALLSSASYLHIPTVQLVVGGSVLAPSYAFDDGATGDTDTGLYRSAANQIGFAGGGKAIGNLKYENPNVGFEVGNINNTTAGAAVAYIDLHTGGGADYDVRIRADGGHASTAGQGSFRIDALDFALVIGGVTAFTGDSTSLNASATTGSAKILVGNGSAGTPAFEFVGDNDTGMFRQGADSLGFSTGGTERGRFTSAGIFFTTPNTSASAADLRSGSSALTNIVRSTSSRKYKRDFRKLDTPWGVLSKLNPVRFWSIPDERDMVGFVAEEVGDVIPDARDNENYDHRAVLAYAVAGLVDAERRITQLEDIVLKGEPYAKVP